MLAPFYIAYWYACVRCYFWRYEPEDLYKVWYNGRPF